MTSDLIPAVCPNCGGKLNVDPGSDTLICQFCQTEHIIRRSVGGTINLEAYARCPLCRRNDQAEKVSAILNKQQSQSTGFVQQQQIYTGSDGRTYTRTVNVPVQTTHTTDLARKFTPPVQPSEPQSGSSWTILVLAVIVAIIEVCVLVVVLVSMAGSYGSTTEDKVVQILTALGCGGMAFLIPIGLFVWFGASKKKNDVRVAQDRRAYAQAYQQWERAMSRYNRLYYCGRDDVVFVPGEKTSASVADVWTFLYTFPER